MPYFVVERVTQVLNKASKSLKGSKILVLGIAYKKDIDDNRESPGVKIIDLLIQKGAWVDYHDPYIPHCRGMRHYPHLDLTSVPLTAETLARYDLALLVTDHSVFDYPWIASRARLIVDTRNAFKGLKAPHIYQA